MRILLTGGAGYIGSHTALVLLQAGYDVTIVDDYSNSSPEVLRRIQELANRPIASVNCDLADRARSNDALSAVDFDAVIHFAGLKSVGESVEQPSVYYRTNLTSTLNILDIMADRGVDKFVFSSSATVYGTPLTPTINEEHAAGHAITNPYGWSKSMNEQIIRDVQRARPALEATLLRYFNPVGAHPSGLIGESPLGTPNNLMPYVAQVAAGRRPHVNVYGNAYATPDGTGVRDYIHVMDLAHGHLAALEHIAPGVETYNLGTGRGHSVLDVIREFTLASGHEIPYRFAPPRQGDVASAVADPRKANDALGWSASLSLAESCQDAWRWQSQNPLGLNRGPGGRPRR